MHRLAMMTRRIPSAAAVFCTFTSLAQAETSLSGELTLASDYAFRGVSQTMSKSALNLTLTAEHESGWYGQIWASNVDFTGSGDPDDGASIEVDFEVGLSRELSQRLDGNIALAAYTFPGTMPGYDYNYSEWLGALVLDDRHQLTIGYSDNVMASGQSGIFYAFDTSFELPADLWLGIEVGHYDLGNAYALSYDYGELSLGGQLGRTDWRLSHIAVKDAPTKLFSETAVENRTVVSLSISF